MEGTVAIFVIFYSIGFPEAMAQVPIRKDTVYT